MFIKPLNGHVLIEPASAATQSKGGIYLPDTAQEKPAEGYVRALPADSGDEVDLGDRVIYKRFSGEDLVVEGKEYKMVPFGELLAKYVEGDAIPE
ncbi:MAG: co-chaperone GroES [Myxococcales bacterium]|nr:co-chaperone GroES [Myxococcales bacterium]